MRRHRWQPTRLPRPWDSPGKNTGVWKRNQSHRKFTFQRLGSWPPAGGNRDSRLRSVVLAPSLEMGQALTEHPMRLPRLLSGKESACLTERTGSILGSGRSPEEGNGNPFQYSCLENPMDRGACWATIHGVTKSWTRLKRLSTHTWMNNTGYSVKKKKHRII